jgi:hypothetical protein
MDGWQANTVSTAEGRIMSSFSVSNCFYDGTSVAPDPLCCVTGSVNGLNVPLAPAFLRYLMAANATDQMQAALTAVMFNYYADV